jgi:hypothetical protein
MKTAEQYRWGKRIRKSNRGDYNDKSTMYLQIKYQDKTPSNNK